MLDEEDLLRDVIALGDDASAVLRLVLFFLDFLLQLKVRLLLATDHFYDLLLAPSLIESAFFLRIL